MTAALLLDRSGEKCGLDGAGIFFRPLTDECGTDFLGEFVMVLRAMEPRPLPVTDDEDDGPGMPLGLSWKAITV